MLEAHALPKENNVTGTKSRIAGLFLALSLIGPPVGATTADGSPMSGAKALFTSELNSKRAPENVGFTYSIELKRDNKIYTVDSRYTFKSGDMIRFHVRPNIDGFMYIHLKDGASGMESLMFPYPHAEEDNRVAKGRTYTLPETAYLLFDKNPGVETVKLTLSPKAIKEFAQVRPERTIVITPKKDKPIAPSNVAFDFRSADPNMLTPISNSADAMENPAMTLVSTDKNETNISVEMMLQHQRNAGSTAVPVITTASGSSGLNLPNKSKPTGDTTKVSSAQTGTPTFPKLPVTGSISGGSAIADKWAVVVGISQFKNPKYNLRYPDKDARDFAALLVRDCYFAADHVKVLTNEQATRENILTAIGADFLPKNAKENDLVCIFMATHGTSAAMDVRQKNFLVAYDTNPANPYVTGIEIQDLAREVIRRMDAKRVVLILDTCHSGAAEAGSKGFAQPFDITDLVQGTGHLIIASAEASQTAHDSLRYENGIFTKHLMDALRANKRMRDAFEYTKAKTNDESLADFRKEQTPILKDAKWEGADLKIAAPPLSPRKPVKEEE
jgi:hypothetical protein